MRSALPVALLVMVLLSACTGRRAPTLPPPETVCSVDLARYAGAWYEIASYPNRFQRGCSNTSATYTPQPDGRIEVVNRCIREGKAVSVKGTATVADRPTNARLRVTFFWPFAGDYWIIDLGEQYEYAVVSNPDRSFLWVLSRTPVMDEARFTRIIARLQARSFDTSRLVRTVQSGP